MSKAEGKKLISAAKEAGRKYAIEQIESEQYSDFLASSIYEAEQHPESHNLVRTKADAMRAARNYIVDLKHDISRNIDVSRVARIPSYIPASYDIKAQDIRDAFWEGLHEALDRKNVQSWLADEILFRSKEAAGIE